MEETNVPPVVSATGLTKEFRDFWGRPKARAVNDIDFEIRQGEVIGLLGPNGSGKSTTVKMLLGLLYPTGGRLTVLGRSPRAVETKRDIGYLPEESYLYKYLTAEETLDFFGSLFNLSAADRANRIEQLLDMVGMTHARRRRVGEFSKGMQRRIGIAQAMINDPSFLILDEPTSGLDPLGCREVKDLILTLKKRGKTVLVTSHLLSDVEDICDRVIILYGGKIRAQGALNDLLTVSDSTTITTPVLGKEEMEKVLKVLREELHGEDFKVDHPRRSLEEFFLDVIARAKSESVETAGVVSGGRIAKYLESGDEKSAVLESLLQEETPQAPAPAPRQEEIAAEKKEQPARVDLSDLMEEKSVKVSEEAPDRTAAAAEKLSEADKKLNDILGNRK
jgi:ABC-2 type transport system ATP-binding protein